MSGCRCHEVLGRLRPMAGRVRGSRVCRSGGGQNYSVSAEFANPAGSPSCWAARSVQNWTIESIMSTTRTMSTSNQIGDFVTPTLIPV